MAIRSISTFVPNDRINNFVQAARLGRDEEFVRSRLGFDELARMDTTGDMKGLALGALRKLITQNPNLLDRVSALVLVTQSPDFEGLPHTSAWLQSETGMSTNVACFDLGLGCSGFTYGLLALEGFLRSAGLTTGILVTADPYSPMVDPDDLATAVIFGDAATATWVELSEPSDSPDFHVVSSDFGTDGSLGEAIARVSGTLRMDGRSVYTFAKRIIPRSIRLALEKGEISESEVSAFLMHQGSLAVVNAIAQQFPGLEDRFVWSSSAYGNTVSSSIPMALAPLLDDSTMSTIVVSGFGVGLSWGTLVLARPR